jgi:hypothetical protein
MLKFAMQRSFILKAVTGLSWGLLLLNGVFTPPAWAGRYVLNQTPQAIQRYFGRYQTRQTTKDGVIYTYAPATLRWLFPQFPKSNFSITFVNARSKYITINFNGSFNDFPDTYNYEQAEASKFFNYIFGYQPPIWKELSDRFTGNETVHDYEYCLGDGVATTFERYGYIGMALS